MHAATKQTGGIILTWLAGFSMAVLGVVETVYGQVTSREYHPWSRAQVQFINREYYPWWDERYENYSLLSYRDYGQLAARGENATYDPFGNFLVDGVDLLRVEEYRTLAPRRSSQVFRSARLRTNFRNLVVMRDHYQGWSNRLMVGDALEARFSSLTLNQPRLEGLRWDGSSHKNRFSMVSSRVSSPIAEGNNDQSFATYLFGGRWESQLGDVLTLGATYVNLHLRDSMQRQGSIKGAFPSVLGSTRAYYVIFSDDSPEDGEGIQVFAVEVFVNGVQVELSPQIRLVEAVANPDHVAHLRRNRAWAPECITAELLLKEGSGHYYTRGIPVGRQAPWSVGRTDLLVLRYEVPNDVEELRFRAQVSGDYSIDVGASFPWEGVADRSWSDLHNVARARGNVQDGSNLRWVEFQYGFLTGLFQYGSNVTVNLFGMTLEAEYANNISHRQFPHTLRHRSKLHRAYFARAWRPFGRGTAGMEVFDVPAGLQTAMPMWSEYSNKVLTYELIADNDDGDEWPDSWEHWDPLDPLYISLRAAGMDPEGQPTQQAKDRLIGNLGRGVGFGVYPGLDLDNDGVLDINITQKHTPDYVEPFLMYYVEPDEFVYGDDYNNNGIVEVRENDNRPDYPYPLDSRGYHFFGKLHLPAGISLHLGRYDIRQRAGSGRNEVNYAELVYAESHERWGEVGVNYRIKRVRDDIPDPVYQVVIDPLSSTNTAIQIRHDPLLMRDSWVNTLFMESRFTHLDGLNLINTTKLEVNAQGRDSGEIRGNIIDWHLVSKADYRWQLGRLTLMPMAKLLLHRRQALRELLFDLHTYELFPIFRLDYALGERTMLRAGVQGIPGWPHLFRDLKFPRGDFDARHYLFVVQNNTNYTGYDLSINMGFLISRRRFENIPSHRVHRFKEFFIQARVR